VQQALRFGGDDVGTIFKNLQLDIGAPHQFMDFQFRLDGPESGEFWLPHCIAIDSSIVRIFDPHCHEPAGGGATAE
jgi:hypothetical protein